VGRTKGVSSPWSICGKGNRIGTLRKQMEDGLRTLGRLDEWKVSAPGRDKEPMVTLENYRKMLLPWSGKGGKKMDEEVAKRNRGKSVRKQVGGLEVKKKGGENFEGGGPKKRTQDYVGSGNGNGAAKKMSFL